jgi:uroporphyrinogen-III synthase
MSARIAVTRAEPGASKTAAAIAARGGTPILAPLLTIVPAPDLNRDLGGAQALVFTSSNGARAFAPATAQRPVFAVEDATAAAARAAGFGDVRSAAGDVDALAALIAAACAPGGGPLLHVSGADVAGDLAGALAARGFTVERRIAYRAEAAQALPAALADALARGDLDAVLFHSARAAEAFVALAAVQASGLDAVCMSAAVAQGAAGAPWLRLSVAAKPQEDALIYAAFAAAATRA